MWGIASAIRTMKARENLERLERWKEGVFNEPRPKRTAERSALAISFASALGAITGGIIAKYNLRNPGYENLNVLGCMTMIGFSYTSAMSAIYAMEYRSFRKMYEKYWNLHNPDSRIE